MANEIVTKLRGKHEAAWQKLGRQLEGMEAHMERSDAPGEWTTREVLTHLLFEPGWDPVAKLRDFAQADLPLVEIDPGKVHMTPERKQMTLQQFKEALDRQRRAVFGYVETLDDAALQQRKARIPFFKAIAGSEEVPLGRYVGALWDYHWQDHAGQLAKIRKAVGLPEAK
jgi:hypothetical protein